MKPKHWKHLRPETRRWCQSVATEFELDEHHLRLLLLAGQTWDRCEQAREALAAHGLTYDDANGQPKARPEVAIERDSRVAFARLVRELGLDHNAPAESYSRGPKIPANAGRRRVG